MSEACRTRPAAEADYKEQGEYIDVGGLKTYRAGRSDAAKAVFVIYDIYGPAPQTLQGVDILAGIGTDHDDIQVFLPDLLEGQYAQVEWFKPDATPEQVKAKNELFSHVGAPARIVTITPKIASELSQKYPSIKSWGALGLCWGAKPISLLSGEGSSFKAAAEAHPAFLDPKDAESVTIPMCILASKDENAEAVKSFSETLKVEKYVETFADQIHGWMGARSDLTKERNREEFLRGYGIVVDFMRKHL